MQQIGAVFIEGERYIRVKESGWIYPLHPETEKMIRKDAAEYVVLIDKEWNVIHDTNSDEPKKVVSTPARRPEPPKVNAPQPAPVVKSTKVPADVPTINLIDGLTEPK